MHTKIKDYISSLDQNIENSRKPVLEQLAAYIRDNENPELNFICTHNSRRSHLSQIWAQVFAHHAGIKVSTFSGGTEATAFHPNAVAALRRVGFDISAGVGENPRYQVSFSKDHKPMTCFSKTFDDQGNPSSGFAAIMTCSEADADCPYVPGASARIKLFYEDPKVSDGTSKEALTYDERCAQIAREMRYIFSIIKS
ncbi:low molecular weight phosphatase family protein [Ekhidna sp. To15]|uniref:arsenate-mycothiol transferase ArsC n=1 Tax=Ekhidna sp. To15 TaxID=3395267 RepID=UPI003F527467